MIVSKLGTILGEGVSRFGDSSKRLIVQFSLTSDGQFDFENKRITNTATPLEDGDVINLKYLQTELDKIQRQIDVVSKIASLFSLDGADIVVPSFINESGVDSRRKLRGIGYALEQSDAVNRNVLESSLKRTANDFLGQVKDVSDKRQSIENQFAESINNKVKNVDVHLGDLTKKIDVSLESIDNKLMNTVSMENITSLLNNTSTHIESKMESTFDGLRKRIQSLGQFMNIKMEWVDAK